MKHVISCLNLKGGAGKTTICLNLAAALGERGSRVVAVDLDPQQSATRWAAQASPSSAANFDLSRDVHTVESKSVRLVKDIIERLIGESGASLVLVDCPPELEDRSLMAAMLSDLVLVPTTPSPLDLWAAEAAVGTARDARAVRERELPLISLVPSRLVTSTVLARELPESLAEFGEPVAPGISQRVAIVEAAVAGQTIDQYAPDSPGHQEFLKLAEHVNERLFLKFVNS